MTQRELWNKILGFEPNDVEMYTYVFSKMLHTNLQANMVNFQKKHDFERMELLGDSLLQTIITEKLFHDYSTGSPGQLTRLRSRMVRNDTLHLITKMLDFQKKFELFDNAINKEEIKLAFENVKSQADIFETLIGVIYLDHGWFFVKHWVIDVYTKFDIQNLVLQDDNFVDILQSVTKSNLPTFSSTTTPEYKTIVSCVFNGKFYSTSGCHKPHVKQKLCQQILLEMIEKGTISKDIFDFKPGPQV